MQTPTSEHKENEIINVLQKGYMYQQKVLRPSRVNVATAEWVKNEQKLLRNIGS